METTFGLRFVAADDNSRSKGLMHSEKLGENEAVLFIFPTSQRHAFWNKNVSFPIDVAYLDDAMQIVDIQNLAANQERCISPVREARYVVEANRGVFANLGFTLGDIAIIGENRTSVTFKHNNKAKYG